MDVMVAHYGWYAHDIVSYTSQVVEPSVSQGTALKFHETY